MSKPIQMPAAAAAALLLIGSAPAVALAVGRMPASEIGSVLNAKTSLAEAVGAVEKKSGGHATAADVLRTPRGYEYKVTVVANGKVMDQYVALAWGKIVKSVARGKLAKAFDGAQQQRFNKMMSSPTTMLGAIAAAEKKEGASAITARLIDTKGNAEFKVELAKNGKRPVRETITVDLATGKIVAEAAAKPGLRASTKSNK